MNVITMYYGERYNPNTDTWYRTPTFDRLEDLQEYIANSGVYWCVCAYDL